MPKFLLSIMEDASAGPQMTEAQFQEIYDAHTDFARTIEKHGGSCDESYALQPISTATFLRGTRTPGVTVVDNPTPELKEVLGGYYLIEAKDEATAVEIAKQCPASAYIEVRPVWEISDMKESAVAD